MRKNLKNYFSYSFTFFLILGIFFIATLFLPKAYGQLTPPQEISTVPKTHSQFFNKPVFKENELSSEIVSPIFNDNSTNIAFYIKCPNTSCPNDGTIESPVYIFSAENLGHGALPFSDYWAPPIASDYVAVEYKNDEQHFSCSGISLDECFADPHFINVFYFTLVNNATEITPEMLAEKAKLNNPNQIVSTATTTASDSLLLLSIRLSSTSISSNLDNGLIVTATLDGIASIATSSVSNTDTPTSTEADINTTTETDEDTKVGSFIMNIVDSIIEIFTPEETTTTEPVNNEPTQSETVPVESTQSEPSLELPTVETPTNESTQENEVQSSISTDNSINNEVITTEF